MHAPETESSPWTESEQQQSANDCEYSLMLEQVTKLGGGGVTNAFFFFNLSFNFHWAIEFLHRVLF